MNGEPTTRSAQPGYTLAELLKGVTPEAMREAFDWGDDVGREDVLDPQEDDSAPDRPSGGQ